MRPCPHCGKEIKDKSDICKWCHGDVSPAAVAALSETRAAAQRPHPETKTCPFCAEEIKWEAKVCKHCQRDLQTGTVGGILVQPTPQWNKGIAAVLSLVIPGAGQMYKGQVANGLVWLVFVIIGYFALVVPGVILHILCILGAASGDPYRNQRSIGGQRVA
jgi:TM2 domain-containing membrane protein YozV